MPSQRRMNSFKRINDKLDGIAFLLALLGWGVLTAVMLVLVVVALIQVFGG